MIFCFDPIGCSYSFLPNVMLNCSQPCMVYMTIWGNWGVSDG
jgi:hypothetical protein